MIPFPAILPSLSCREKLELAEWTDVSVRLSDGRSDVRVEMPYGK